MIQRRSRPFPAACSAAAPFALVAGLAGCGGGSIDVTPDPSTQPVAVSGVVVKGPVAGARVCAGWVVDGAVDASTTACTTTGADGRYAVSVARRDGVLLVEATQGDYVDEAAPGTRVPLTRLRGAVAFSGPQSEVAVQATALTELAVRRTLARGPLAAAGLADADAEVRRAFGVSALHAEPSDPTRPQATVLDAPTTYGLANAGVRGWMVERGLPAASLDAALDTLATKLGSGTLHEELAAFRAGMKRVIDANPASGLRPLSASWAQVVPLQFGQPPVTPSTPPIVETAGTLRYAMPWANPTMVLLVGAAPLACVTNVPAGTSEAAVRASVQAIADRVGQAVSLDPIAACKGSRTAYIVDFPTGRTESGEPN